MAFCPCSSALLVHRNGYDRFGCWFALLAGFTASYATYELMHYVFHVTPAHIGGRGFENTIFSTITIIRIATMEDPPIWIVFGTRVPAGQVRVPEQYLRKYYLAHRCRHWEIKDVYQNDYSIRRRKGANPYSRRRPGATYHRGRCIHAGWFSFPTIPNYQKVRHHNERLQYWIQPTLRNERILCLCKHCTHGSRKCQCLLYQ